MIANEMEDVEIGSGAIAGKQGQNVPKQAAKSDEDELRALEAMMS